MEKDIFGEDGSKIAAENEKRANPANSKTNPLCSLEAATGVEPVNNGFADRCLSHLAMPPYHLLERETGLEPATITLAT